jgi:cell wall assembly regulator SMI1
MANNFIKLSSPISLNDVNKIEKEIDVIFPNDFKEHYLKFNGGIPENSYFFMKKYNTFLWLSSFLPIKNERENQNMTLEKTYIEFLERKIIPKEFIPFAYDWGGNYFCLNIKNNEVYMVYTDLGNPMENPDSVRKLTKGFSNFVEALEEKGEDDDV